MSRFTKLLCALCTALITSATALAVDYQFPAWNDYDIQFNYSGGWKVSDDGTSIVTSNVAVGETREIEFVVTVDQDATFTYLIQTNTHSLKVYLDGVEKENLTWNEATRSCCRFIELSPGTHCVKVEITKTVTEDYTSCSIKNIAVSKTPLVSVNLLEPGSLGGEVLCQVESVKDVRKLKVTGEMNDDDWAKIGMMADSLYVLDLSEAKTDAVPASLFASKKCIHTVVLPEGLKSIGEAAFEYTYLRNVNFPSTLESIGSGAFGCTQITEAIMGDNCNTLGGGVFVGCHNLKKVRLSPNLTKILDNAFGDSYNLHDIVLHEGITNIGNNAFENCYNLRPQLPGTLASIGKYAFEYTNTRADYRPIEKTLVIPDNVSYIDNYAFIRTNYETAVVSAKIYKLSQHTFLPNDIKTIKLKSATLITRDSYYGTQDKYKIVSDSYRPNITLQVPDYLVNSYKLDEYWYNFGKIEGFSTEEIDSWDILADLTLGARDRLLDTPSITINPGGSLKINGTDGMPVNNLAVSVNSESKEYGRIFSNADGVTVAGELDLDYYAKTKNRWYYITLPYNVRVSDITGNGQRAIRYYDGASRAENGTNKALNWKNYADDDIIPAGTGFIFCTSEAGTWRFPSMNDESKQYMTSTRVFVRQLEESPATTASNRGWNLVGNPYQCWYNIHKMNFTAPITVRNTSYNGYSAYSIIDDDYALAPNQAFFVQCPEGVSEISFPLEGRQMTSVIQSQNGARPRNTPSVARRLADVTLSNGITTDRTRVVLNAESSMAYETQCDASKFMGDADVPQLYTLDDEGTMYAINERPAGEGLVTLGMSIPAAGTYTLSLTRNTAGSVWLIDNEAGRTVCLTEGDYTFHAEAGTAEERFSLQFAADEATAVNGAQAAATMPTGIYSVTGAYMGHNTEALPAGTYIIRSGAQARKVVIK